MTKTAQSLRRAVASAAVALCYLARMQHFSWSEELSSWHRQRKWRARCVGFAKRGYWCVYFVLKDSILVRAKITRLGSLGSYGILYIVLYCAT